MTDYTELKRLAEACGNLNWRFLQENWTEYAIRDDHGYIATMRVKSAKQSGPCPDRLAKAEFLGAVTPAAVLAMIAENERLTAHIADGLDCKAVAIKGMVGLAVENEALRKDAERYRYIRGEMPHADLGRVTLGVISGAEYDEAIDADMSKEASHD
ncbi:hypothetical protein [Pseudomonas viridiflava]|uniref:hypothetical protein n=1 Tax=Pseudomonas viridiflava TaxID=33069 RepID=UPI002EC9E1AC|nr:hypothetical protein [Pseudomonas viridiflava]